MRRVMVGVGVLVAVLLGAGAYAFGAAGGPQSRLAVPAASGASDTSRPAPTPVASSGPVDPSSAAPPARPGSSAASAKGARTTSASRAPVACPQGDRQREVETALGQLGGYGAVSVDGLQSPADCAAITAFQQRFGISPANGRAGPTTADVARRIAASHTPEVQARCRPSGLTACVDLTLQTMWVVRDGAVVWGPTVVRTGFKGHATAVGTYKVNYRNIKEWSNPYEVWLPYWQHFTQGMGFHQTTTYLHDGWRGSHGCVNLLRPDAKELWNLIGHGTTVHTFGRRAGT